MPDMVTKDQIRELIKSEKLRPSDLFDTDHIIADPVVKGYAEDRIKERIGAEFARRKEAEEKLEALEKSKVDLANKLSAYEKATLKSRAKEVFDAVIVERPALEKDERLARYVRRQFDKSFTPTEEAQLKDDLNQFIDAAVAEGQELFGEPRTNGDKSRGVITPQQKGGASAKGGRGRTIEEIGDTTADDSLLNPDNNELIPRD